VEENTGSQPGASLAAVGARVLVVSADGATTLQAERLLATMGHQVEVAGSLQAAVEKASCGYDVLLIDVQAPGVRDPALLQNVLASAGHGSTVALTGAQSLPAAGELMQQGVAHLALKPLDSAHIGRIVDSVKELADLRGERVSLDSRLRRLMGSLIGVMVRAIEAKHAKTAAHLRRTGDIAAQMADQIPEVRQVAGLARIGGLVHDLGLIGIAEDILDGGGPLSDEQWVQVRNHTVVGAEMIDGIDELRAVVPAVRSHHERMDGKGYPDGLAGQDIPLLARVTSVACAFDTMVNRRIDSLEKSKADALAELRRCQGTQFDPDCVEALAQALGASAAAVPDPPQDGAEPSG